MSGCQLQRGVIDPNIFCQDNTCRRLPVMYHTDGPPDAQGLAHRSGNNLTITNSVEPCCKKLQIENGLFAVNLFSTSASSEHLLFFHY